MISDHGIKGFKFHPPMQNFHPYDRMAWPIYEVIAEHGMPVVFHFKEALHEPILNGNALRLLFGK